MSTNTNNNTNTTTNSKVSAAFTSLQLVTCACHSVLNTSFTPLDPKPDWFDSLNEELEMAKDLAKHWIDDLAPKMTSTIPTNVLNYSTTYKAMTDQILSLINKEPLAKGKDNPTVQQVFALIDAIKSSIDDIINNISSTEKELTEWGDEMQKSHDNLFNKSKSIQDAEQDLQASIDKMNQAINSIRTEIDSENKAIMYSELAVGIGIFALVAGLALSLVTFGAGMVVASVGLLGIIGGGISWGVMQAKINSQLDDIANDQRTISDDQRQIVALQGLSTASSSVISYIEIATSSLSDVKVMWETFQGELQGVCDKIDKADEGIFAIVNEGYIIASQNEWALVEEFAEKLTEMQLNVETKQIPITA